MSELSVIDFISKVGFDETFGARPIKRAIQDKIEDLISEKILMSEIKEGENYNLTIVNDNVVIGNKVVKQPWIMSQRKLFKKFFKKQPTYDDWYDFFLNVYY